MIADSSKPVDRIGPPIPLELYPLASPRPWRGSRTSPGRHAAPDTPTSPDGGVIADYLGDVGDPAELAARLAAVPGVIDHGLFPALVSEVLIGRGDSVERA